MPGIEHIKYEKRERPPATDKNPTITSLLSSRDRKDWVEVVFPKATPYFDSEGRSITHQPIMLNTQEFKPGQKYTLPPIVAAELRAAIRNSTEAIALQMQKRNKANIPSYQIQGDDGSTKAFEDAESMFEELEQVV